MGKKDKEEEEYEEVDRLKKIMSDMGFKRITTKELSKNDNEKNSNKRNLKEKIKNFWKDFKKNTLWVNIGVYISTTIWTWVLFCGGFVNLAFAIFFTIMIPLPILLMYYVRKSKHLKIIIKIVLVGCGGYVFGGIMWFIIGYVLIQAPWAPLRILIGDAAIRGSILLLLVISSYAIAAYIMYRIGKKRKWRPPARFEIE